MDATFQIFHIMHCMYKGQNVHTIKSKITIGMTIPCFLTSVAKDFVNSLNQVAISSSRKRPM